MPSSLSDPALAEAAVSWRDVRKVYDDGHIALGGVSLHVARGEILAILGTSGSGKTTLLKLVNRLADPTSGEVWVGDRPTSAWNPIELRRSMGYVIQEAGLMPHLSVLDNVALGCRLVGMKKPERNNKAEEWSSKGSTVLQLLVSIMGLILVREPYYSKCSLLHSLLL